jgi:hypothetical protein
MIREDLSEMFGTIPPQVHSQKNGFERDRISIPGKYNIPTKKPAPVVCFACRKELNPGERHNHAYSRE